MNQSEIMTATANFYFPGTNVIMELITKENPMTNYRKRKIRAFRASGYKVLVWYEHEIQTPEGMDRKMKELYEALGREWDQEELNKYKEKRYQLHHELFGESGDVSLDS